MLEIEIDVVLGSLQNTLHELCDKHFVQKQELSRYELELLNDLHTLLMRFVHKEIIRKHFSTKK